MTLLVNIRLLVMCLLLVSTRTVHGDPTSLPIAAPEPIDEAVKFEFDDKKKRAYIDLDEELDHDVCVAVLNYIESSPPLIGEPNNGQSIEVLGAQFRQNDTTKYWSLWVNNKQDYEQPEMREYMFPIYLGSEAILIVLHIQNINDNPTIIQASEKNCSIKENFVGPSNCHYLITDADGWDNKTVISLYPESERKHFSLVTSAGDNPNHELKAVVNVTESLDFETTSVYMLEIRAIDGNGNNGTLDIVVSVLDVADQSPVWTLITTAVNILEKSTKQFKVLAIDGDIQINEEINYKIDVTDDRDKTLFTVDEKTGLVTINEIDRDERKQEVFQFRITAYEKSDFDSNITQNIVVIVEDINDHSPEITPDCLEIAIDEETYTTLEFDKPIKIEDPDLAENALFSVSLTDESKYKWSSAFAVVPTSGYQSGVFTISVSNASLIDYEDPNWRNIIIQLRATERTNASHVGIRNINITLNNLNDELPIFDERTPLNVSVFEDVEELSSIATVHATDRDVGDNVTHSLVAQRTLRINETTGEIITNQANALDYESMPIMVVQIVATDLALHRTYTILTINVIDVNDVPPELYLPKESPTLEEELKLGTEVNATITATDIDTEPELVFSIDWANTRAQKRSVVVNESCYRENLAIETKKIDKNQVQGKLIVTGRIDYEDFDVIFLSISVTDIKTKHNENTTSGLLTLYIKDINDNAPVFVNPPRLLDVDENQGENVLIGIVTATDADGPEFNNVSYSIKPINNTKEGLVVIDSLTGVIKVGQDRAIDAEEYEYLCYNVTATDGYNHKTIDITILVNDLNDNVPELCNEKVELTLSIPEKSPNGTFIVKIEGKDDDRTSPFNNISYLINENYPTPMEYFSIGRFDGRILVNLTDGFKLDRDRGPSEFTLNLKLRDNYLNGTSITNTHAIDTTVKIILTDINDKEPVLPYLGDPASNVSENTKKGDLVLKVVAEDHDDPNTNNTRIFYVIKNITPAYGEYDMLDPNCKTLFVVRTVNETAAEILANCPLKGYYGRWIIELYAQDRGTIPGPLNYTRNYVVDVIDFNYNRPEILYPNSTKIPLRKEQTLHAPLRTYENRLLNDCQAEDKDYGDSGIVTFSLTSATGDHENFEIVPISKNVARLRQAQELNLVVQNSYTLTIVAEDGGNPPLNTSEDCTLIYVTKSGPSFVDNTWTVWIKENKTGLNYFPKIPEARDMIGDSAGNLLPLYYFFMPDEDDTKYFALNKSTRVLSLTQELDREKQENIIIHVVATPFEDEPPRNPLEDAVLEITVVVLDENDEAPNFNNKSYRAGVSIQDSLDKLLLTVKAVDADLNDTLTYNIISNSTNHSHSSLDGINDPFWLDSASGELFLKFRVTNDMRGFFRFNISVHDEVDHRDTAVVWIHIAPQSYRIVFTFNNFKSKVEQERTFIIETITNIFGYMCVIDDIKNAADANNQVIDNVTTVTTHFISSTNHELIDYDTIILLASELQTISNLKAIFLTSFLYLLDVPTDSSIDTSNGEDIVHWILVSLTIFFSSCSIGLLVVFIIKTKRLNERLKKLAITRYGSQESGLDRAGKVPTTNQFSIVGSNPIWKTSEKSFEDNFSQGSGGSDLIGIEENPDFGYVNAAIMSKEEWQNGTGVSDARMDWQTQSGRHA